MACNSLFKKWLSKTPVKGYQVNIYLFKANHRNTRKRRKIWSKLTIRVPEQNLTPYCCLHCWLWTYFEPFSSVSIVHFEPVNVCWHKQPLEVFCEKNMFFEIWQNSQENTCARVSFFSKVSGLMPASLLIKRLWNRYFPVNFAKILRTPFILNTSVRLLLCWVMSILESVRIDKSEFLYFIQLFLYNISGGCF